MGAVRSEGSEWRARPVLAAAMRAGLAVTPAAGSLVVVVLVSRLVPASPTALPATGRLAAMLGLACAVGYLLDRLARRALPLVVLLRMSLLFPDRAPSRFRLARRACSTDVRTTLRPRAGDDAAAVAERVVGLLAALSAHDRYTRGHSQRVQVLAEMLARELGVSRGDRHRLRWAALLHDVGKLSVDAAVLTKPSSLADDEWAQVRRHPDEGARLCGPLLDWLGPWGLAIPQHHERYDGGGYPRGLAGADIAYAGRLVSLVDAFETMTATRPYKKPLVTRDARAELARCAGSHFDPVMVRAFLAIPLPRLLWASGPLSFLVQLPFLPVIEAGGRAATAALATAGTGLLAGGAAVVIAGVASPAPATAAPLTDPVASSGTTSPTANTGGSTPAGSSVPGAASSPGGTGTTGFPTTRPGSGPSLVPSPSASGTPVPTSSSGPLPVPLPTSALPLPTLPVPTLPVPTLPIPTFTVPSLPVPLPTSVGPLPTLRLLPSSTASSPPTLLPLG